MEEVHREINGGVEPSKVACRVWVEISNDDVCQCPYQGSFMCFHFGSHVVGDCVKPLSRFITSLFNHDYLTQEWIICNLYNQTQECREKPYMVPIFPYFPFTFPSLSELWYLYKHESTALNRHPKAENQPSLFEQFAKSFSQGEREKWGHEEAPD